MVLVSSCDVNIPTLANSKLGPWPQHLGRDMQQGTVMVFPPGRYQYMLCRDQVISNCCAFAPQRTFGIVWRYFCLVVTSVLLASGGQRPEILLNFLPCIGQLP